MPLELKALVENSQPEWVAAVNAKTELVFSPDSAVVDAHGRWQAFLILARKRWPTWIERYGTLVASSTLHKKHCGRWMELFIQASERNHALTDPILLVFLL